MTQQTQTDKTTDRSRVYYLHKYDEAFDPEGVFRVEFAARTTSMRQAKEDMAAALGCEIIRFLAHHDGSPITDIASLPSQSHIFVWCKNIRPRHTPPSSEKLLRFLKNQALEDSGQGAKPDQKPSLSEILRSKDRAQGKTVPRLSKRLQELSAPKKQHTRLGPSSIIPPPKKRHAPSPSPLSSSAGPSDSNSNSNKGDKASEQDLSASLPTVLPSSSSPQSSESRPASTESGANNPISTSSIHPQDTSSPPRSPPSQTTDGDGVQDSGQTAFPQFTEPSLPDGEFASFCSSEDLFGETGDTTPMSLTDLNVDGDEPEAPPLRRTSRLIPASPESPAAAPNVNVMQYVDMQEEVEKEDEDMLDESDLRGPFPNKPGEVEGPLVRWWLDEVDVPAPQARPKKQRVANRVQFVAKTSSRSPSNIPPGHYRQPSPPKQQEDTAAVASVPPQRPDGGLQDRYKSAMEDVLSTVLGAESSESFSARSRVVPAAAMGGVGQDDPTYQSESETLKPASPTPMTQPFPSTATTTAVPDSSPPIARPVSPQPKQTLSNADKQSFSPVTSNVSPQAKQVASPGSPVEAKASPRSDEEFNSSGTTEAMEDIPVPSEPAPTMPSEFTFDAAAPLHYFPHHPHPEQFNMFPGFGPGPQQSPEHPFSNPFGFHQPPLHPHHGAPEFDFEPAATIEEVNEEDLLNAEDLMYSRVTVEEPDEPMRASPTRTTSTPAHTSPGSPSVKDGEVEAMEPKKSQLAWYVLRQLKPVLERFAPQLPEPLGVFVSRIDAVLESGEDSESEEDVQVVQPVNGNAQDTLKQECEQLRQAVIDLDEREQGQQERISQLLTEVEDSATREESLRMTVKQLEAQVEAEARTFEETLNTQETRLEKMAQRQESMKVLLTLLSEAHARETQLKEAISTIEQSVAVASDITQLQHRIQAVTSPLRTTPPLTPCPSCRELQQSVGALETSLTGPPGNEQQNYQRVLDIALRHLDSLHAASHARISARISQTTVEELLGDAERTVTSHASKVEEAANSKISTLNTRVDTLCSHVASTLGPQLRTLQQREVVLEREIELAMERAQEAEEAARSARAEKDRLQARVAELEEAGRLAVRLSNAARAAITMPPAPQQHHHDHHHRNESVGSEPLNPVAAGRAAPHAAVVGRAAAGCGKGQELPTIEIEGPENAPPRTNRTGRGSQSQAYPKLSMTAMKNIVDTASDGVPEFGGEDLIEDQEDGETSPGGLILKDILNISANSPGGAPTPHSSEARTPPRRSLNFARGDVGGKGRSPSDVLFNSKIEAIMGKDRHLLNLTDEDFLPESTPLTPRHARPSVLWTSPPDTPDPKLAEDEPDFTKYLSESTQPTRPGLAPYVARKGVALPEQALERTPVATSLPTVPNHMSHIEVNGVAPQQLRKSSTADAISSVHEMLQELKYFLNDPAC